MGISWKAMPRMRASSRASSSEWAELYREGMATPRTAAGPSAAAATQAVSALSMPPESPTTAERKPHLRT